MRHKASSALAFAGGAGPGNKVSLPSAGVLFVGETFVLQALSSTLLKGAACEFVARSVAQVAPNPYPLPPNRDPSPNP